MSVNINFNFGAGYPNQACHPGGASGLANPTTAMFQMMQLIQLMMGLMQTMSQGFGGQGLLPRQQHPGFGTQGSHSSGTSFANNHSRGPAVNNFLGNSRSQRAPIYTGGSQQQENISIPQKALTNRSSGAFGTQTVGGRASMKTGTLVLKDPKTGKVLGSYKFRSGGFGRGAAPWGNYEVSNGYRRNDHRGMKVGKVGYSFNLTQKGMPPTQAKDPRFSTPRSQLLIHPDGNAKGTMGCIGIVGGEAIQADFYRKAKALQNKYGGKFNLSFRPS